MIGVPHIVLFGLIEAVIVLLAGVVLLGVKVLKISRSASKPEAEDTVNEVEVLEEKIRSLKSELEKISSVSAEPEAEDMTAEIEALKRKIHDLESELEKARAVENSSAGEEAPQESEQAVPEQSLPEQSVGEDDNVSATPQDVVLMNSLQVKILREQQVELTSVIESLEQGSGSKETAGELVRLKGVDQKVSEIIKAFEKQNSALKQLAEDWDIGSGQEERDEELAASRVRIAELQEELSKTKEEITSLEHEYDVLYNKTSTTD